MPQGFVYTEYTLSLKGSVSRQTVHSFKEFCIVATYAQMTVFSGRPTKYRYCRYTATKGRFLVFYIGGAQWRHPANATEPSVYGDVAALCQVTLTTCYYYYRTVPRSELRKVLFLALSVTFSFFSFCL